MIKVKVKSPVFYGRFVGCYQKQEAAGFGSRFSSVKDVPQISVASRGRNHLVDCEPVTVGNLNFQPGQFVSFQLKLKQYGGSVRPVPCNLSVSDKARFCEINDVDIEATYAGVISSVDGSQSDAHHVYYTSADGRSVQLRTTLPSGFAIKMTEFDTCVYNLAVSTNNGQPEVYARDLREPGMPKPIYVDSEADKEAAEDDLPFIEQ